MAQDTQNQSAYTPIMTMLEEKLHALSVQSSASREAAPGGAHNEGFLSSAGEMTGMLGVVLSVLDEDWGIRGEFVGEGMKTADHLINAWRDKENNKKSSVRELEWSAVDLASGAGQAMTDALLLNNRGLLGKALVIAEHLFGFTPEHFIKKLAEKLLGSEYADQVHAPSASEPGNPDHPELASTQGGKPGAPAGPDPLASHPDMQDAPPAMTASTASTPAPAASATASTDVPNPDFHAEAASIMAAMYAPQTADVAAPPAMAAPEASPGSWAAKILNERKRPQIVVASEQGSGEVSAANERLS